VMVQGPGDQKPRPVALSRATADFSQADFQVQKAIGNNPASGWAIAPQFGKDHVAVFELKEKLASPGTLTFTLEHKYTGKDHNIGKFRLAVTDSPPPVQAQGLPEDLAKAVHTDPAKRTQQQKDLLQNANRARDPRVAELQRAAAEHAVPADARLMGAQDLACALLNSRAFLFNR
jgi:hypothetical protein